MGALLRDGLNDPFLDDLTLDIGEAEISALVATSSNPTLA